jgi:hypothetical protein
MLPEKRQSDLHSSDAGALRQAASDSFAAVQMAHLRYEHVLEAEAEERALSTEDMANIRQQGREYAEAVTRYSNAAIAWLAFTEIFNQDTTKF